MDAATFILFGATGDLAKRKIYPALFNLYLDGKLPQQFRIIGLGRKALSDSDLQQRVEHSILSFSRRTPTRTAALQKFLETFHYSSLDVSKAEDYQTLLSRVKEIEQTAGIPENRMFYMSVAPEHFGLIARHIKESGLTNVSGWKKLVIEKPFGRDLKTAQALNEQLSQAFEENEVYRIDHYLGKAMIQNLESLEYTNPILQALWKNQYIANVQITASEKVGVEERADYYDKTGAIRDMFQNHLMQILMMMTMQLPKHSGSEVVALSKKLVLEQLRPINKDDVQTEIVRGQYTAGQMNGTQLAAYREEPGVPADSMNDTFVAARLFIDNAFWSKVPFYIRTGKRMGEKSTRIVIEFKDPLEKNTESDDRVTPNLFIIEISPNASISFQLNLKSNQAGEGTVPVQIPYSVDERDLSEAYENLICDALLGDPTFFARWDEVEKSWAFVQPILDAFEENGVPLHFYPAGSNGPAAAHELLEQDGYQWWLDPNEETAADPQPTRKEGQLSEALR